MDTSERINNLEKFSLKDGFDACGEFIFEELKSKLPLQIDLFRYSTLDGRINLIKKDSNGFILFGKRLVKLDSRSGAWYCDSNNYITVYDESIKKYVEEVAETLKPLVRGTLKIEYKF